MRNFTICMLCGFIIFYSTVLGYAAQTHVNNALNNNININYTAASSVNATPQNMPTTNANPVQNVVDNVQEKQNAMQAYNEGKFARAYEIWLKLAKAGDGEAMNYLGMLYDAGKGVPLNTKEALTWFRKSAEVGYAGGMSNLGRMLEQGRGTARHVDTAAAWFRKAADLGQADAQYNLGVLYERGEGVVKNEKYAVTWYSLAAANQQVDAQARLGQLYRQGKGVTKDNAKATLFLYGASMNGHEKAREELFAMAEEKYKDKALPQVTLFGVELSAPQGVTRAKLRSSLAVANINTIREDINYICDVYDLKKSVPGASQMAACYGKLATKPSEQPLGFLKIDYNVNGQEQADAIQDMVEKRFGPPSAGENESGALWNLGPVIVATQYVPESNQVGLMYMLPKVYHMTQQVNQ